MEEIYVFLLEGAENFVSKNKYTIKVTKTSKGRLNDFKSRN